MNVAQHVVRGGKLFPGKVALSFEGHQFTYEELDRWSNRIAEGLERIGVVRGDRVALFLPNIPEFAAAYLGIQKLGATAVSLNSTLRRGEVQFILDDSGSVAVFTTGELRETIDVEALPSLEHVIVTDGMEDLVTHSTGSFSPVCMDRDEPSAILYTSGTTGEPKGACLSHGNVVSNVHAFNFNCEMRPDDRIVLFLPLYHCFGQNAILNSAFNICATVVLQRRFDPGALITAIRSEQVTMFFGVPPTFIKMYRQATAADMKSVRYYFSAAAPLPREIARKWQQKYGHAIHEGYGLTETAPFASYNHKLQHKLGSIGAPIENVEMRVVDPVAGSEVPTGEAGEIVVRGPNVMLGYWNRPEATANAIRNGWFHTGDIGRVDDSGYFYIVDRLKDMVNVGGLKVYPVEVENAIYQHPAVEEAAVYGVPDPDLGERVCASIVLKADHELSSKELGAFCRASLADYKIPASIFFVDSIPKSPTGKVLKRVLREQQPCSASAPVARGVSTAEIDEWLRDWLSDHLELTGAAIDADRSFFEYGMTSIIGVKLSVELGAWIGRSLDDVLVWNHGTLRDLMDYLSSRETPVAFLDSATDEEVGRLLEAELGDLREYDD